MLKIIALLALLILLLVSCGETSNNGTEINCYNGNGYCEEPPDTDHRPDIPRYNEYRVSLDIDPSARTVQGISHITFSNRSGVELETIVLRVHLNAFREGAYPAPVFGELEWRAFPNGREYGYMDIQYAFLDNALLDFELDGTILTLNLPEPLAPYSTVQLLLQYNAQIPPISHRTGANDHAMWFGMFLPILAIFDNESGWNTDAHYPAGSPFFSETADYRVEITAPSRYTVVGTGLRTEEVIADTDIKITHFVAQQARNFAFALSPYFQHAFTSTESGVAIHLYYYTESLDANKILNSARRSMEYFENRVGIYPSGHVTIIETELMQDSASFSQMVFVDSWYLNQRRRWALGHALGNQWFANVVGTNRVAEPWLTEGLTRFVQAELFYTTPEAFRNRMENDHASIEERTTLFLNRGLGASPNWSHYAHAHGRKAMLMMYALHHRMGEEIFWEFIANYYQQFSFEIATANDFIALAEEAYGNSLQEFFDEWLNAGTVPPLP
ncbi:MAG: M1 family metallopeptidase [Defluviitaleaceae bacterium]|nr:M1 family metallopeptidase [Defluviitaleaceae bacterium]